MFEKLSKVTTLLALLIAGSVIVLLVGFAAYLSPAWIQVNVCFTLLTDQKALKLKRVI